MNFADISSQILNNRGPAYSQANDRMYDINPSEQQQTRAYNRGSALDLPAYPSEH